MDLPEERDSILALLYAYDVLQDKSFRFSMEKAIDHLLRFGWKSREARGLWCTAYELDGETTARFPEFPRGADVLSTRHAMQALLAMHVATGNEAAGEAIQLAADALQHLPQPDGQWRQVYRLYRDPRNSTPAQAPTTAPTTTRAATTQPIERDTWPTGNFGIPRALAAAARLNEQGRVKYGRELNWKTQIPPTLVGLWDEPFTTPLPQSPDEFKSYLADHLDQRLILENASPADLPATTRHLWLLLLQSPPPQPLPETPTPAPHVP